MNFSRDRWRLQAAGFQAELSDRFFGIGGSPETSIPLNQEIRLLTLEALRRGSPRLYVGLRVVDSDYRVGLDFDEGPLPPDIDLPETGFGIDLVTIAPRVQHDSRDSEFCPAAGCVRSPVIATCPAA